MKRIVAIVLSAMLVISMTGCGDGGAVSSPSAEPVQTVEAEAVPEPAEEKAEYDFAVDLSSIATGDISSGVSVHDPSILRVGDEYYIFGSHMNSAKSKDLTNWEKLSAGYLPDNPVFGQIFEVADEAFAYAGSMDSMIKTDDLKTHVWAPHVIYNEEEQLYYMYYCTSSTWNASNLCYGTSENPEGPYEWKAPLLYSGFTMDNIEYTDVLDYVDEEYAHRHYSYLGEYNAAEYPNAIDPTVFTDQEGRQWMVYGSWSGGIFLLELDRETGKVIHPEYNEEESIDPYFGKRLIGGGHKSIEGPYIVYDEKTDYYYLYVSFGWLEREGGYQVRVFRSKEPDGQYVDMNDLYPFKGAIHKNYGLKLIGNYMLPSLEMAYMAPGHNSVLIDDDGRTYLVYHTRFDNGKENNSPRVHQIILNQDGWPCVLPYQTSGETVSEEGYNNDEICGRYYMTDLNTEIDEVIPDLQIVYLEEDGSVVGETVSGNWKKTDNSYYADITIGDENFSGVFCKMKDEAGTDVMCFSAVGNNHSIWGVKY